MTKTREQYYKELKEKHPNIDELDKSPHINIESLIDSMIMLDSAEFKSRPIVSWDKEPKVVPQKGKMWVLRFILTNKYFLSALVSFAGLMWVIETSKGIGAEWHWFWVYLVAGLFTLGMLGVGILLVLAMFDSWMAD